MLTLVQGLLLVLLYLFVWRVTRAVLRDLRGEGGQAPRAGRGRGGAGSTSASPAELVLRSGSGASRVIALNGQEVTFGRAGPATVVLDDPFVSEQHARLQRAREGWLLVDMGSTNGTYLNRRALDGPVPVQVGDEIGIGQTTVEVRA